MTITSLVNRVQYIGTGTLNFYEYTYRIFNEADLEVTVVDNAVLPVVPIETPLILNVDYSVSGAGSLSGGIISLINNGQPWLIVGKLKLNYGIIIRRVRVLKQETEVRNQGEFFPEIHEDTFDILTTLDQQQQNEIDRSLKLPESVTPASFNTTLPTNINQASISIVTNATGDGLAAGPTVNQISNAQTHATNAATSATNAATSATNAATSATNAADSATEAQQVVDGMIWNDVVFKSFANSPITITDLDRGKVFAIDCTGGNVIVNLPLISSLLFDPWAVGVKKIDSSFNTITVNRAGSDLIDNAVTKIIDIPGAGMTLVPDIDPSPDMWTSLTFGAITGNNIVNIFNGDGITTAFTLTAAPGTQNNVNVHILSLYIQRSEYSVIGTTLTFNSPPAVGVGNIDVVISSLISAASVGITQVTELIVQPIAGNSLIKFKDPSTATRWIMGNDEADLDKFKLCNGSTFGSNLHFISYPGATELRPGNNIYKLVFDSDGQIKFTGAIGNNPVFTIGGPLGGTSPLNVLQHQFLTAAYTPIFNSISATGNFRNDNFNVSSPGQYCAVQLAAMNITGHQNPVSIVALGVDGVPDQAIMTLMTRNGVNDVERLRLDAKGNVVLNIAALATNATDGFLYIPTSVGSPTGIPTTYTGRSPIEYDTLNDRLYGYNGSWRYAPTTTGWNTWAPVYSASGTMTFTSVTTTFARYMIVDKTLSFEIKANGIVGGSNSDELRFTLPNDMANGDGTCYGFTDDLGSLKDGAFGIRSGAAQIGVKRSQGGNYNGGTWGFVVSGSFEIA
jgi:hypothetical protein